MSPPLSCTFIGSAKLRAAAKNNKVWLRKTKKFTLPETDVFLTPLETLVPIGRANFELRLNARGRGSKFNSLLSFLHHHHLQLRGGVQNQYSLSSAHVSSSLLASASPPAIAGRCLTVALPSADPHHHLQLRAGACSPRRRPPRRVASRRVRRKRPPR